MARGKPREVPKDTDVPRETQADAGAAIFKDRSGPPRTKEISEGAANFASMMKQAIAPDEA